MSTGSVEQSQAVPLADPALLDRLSARAPRRHWPRPLRALRALRALLENSGDTQKALDVAYALDGDWSAHQVSLLVGHSLGRQVFSDRPDLLAILSDDAALAGMPEGSFGRAYRDHMTRWGLDADKIVELYRQTDPHNPERDEAQLWLLERENLMHDLFHVLSGYGADGLGEAALLWFTTAQQSRPSRILLSIGASLKVMGFFGARWLPYAFTAWRRGHQASKLLPLPYEDLLPLPLTQVRQALNIQDPNQAHKGGVLTTPQSYAPA